MSASTPFISRLPALLAKLGPFLALIAVLVIFKVALAYHENPTDFWSATNLRLILVQTSIVAISACGMTMIIVAGGIDLSVGSVIALASVAGGVVLHNGYDPLLALAAAMTMGMLVGAVNGSVIAGFGIAPFIVTLGMMGIARGSAKLLADNSMVNFKATWMNKLMQPFPLPSDSALMKMLLVAPGVWIATITAVVMAVLMRKSVFGRNAYAIGSNEAAARLCGIQVRTTKIIIYALAGALFGLSGLLTMAQQGQGNPTTAVGLELDVIAAVVIGGASLSGGAGTILGTIIGALIMSVLRSGTNQMGWSTPWQEILIGLIIVLAVGIDRLRNRRSG
jgi:ribose transport system permease protein